MTADLWHRYCEFFRYYPGAALTLDISRMRFPERLFSELSDRTQAAFRAMSDLERGGIANPDEKRMVGHYWLRAPELAPNSGIRTSIEQMISQVKLFAAKVHSGEIRTANDEKFSHLLVVGIGGSALGPQLVADALGDTNEKLKIVFCDNTDPDGILRTIVQLGKALRSTLVLVISKSGGTVETKNGQLEIAAGFSAQGLSFEKHAVAVTCDGSKLDAQAKEQGWLARFPLWDWVGGRTSLFSAVGLLPAALQGFDIDQMLNGAREMDELTRADTNPTSNPAMLLALMWHHAGGGRGAKDMVVLPYKDRLVLLSKYLQQLVMESLGKEHDLAGKVVNQGIAVYGNKGSTDQHAYIQQLRDGVNNFFATFIEVLQDYSEVSSAEGRKKALEVAPQITSGDYLSGFFLGTREALYNNGRESITLSVDRLNPASLSALIALFERAVGFYATIVNINAYHQPGVEAGKKAAERVIALQREVLNKIGQKGLTAQALSQAIGAENEAEVIYKILEHLVANGRLRRTGDDRHPLRAAYVSA